MRRRARPLVGHAEWLTNWLERRLRRPDRAADPVSKSGWIKAVDEDLVDVLDRLNRYHVAPVGFDNAAPKSVKVSGSFPIKDQAAALRSIAFSSGTTINRSANGVTIVTSDRKVARAR